MTVSTANLKTSFLYHKSALVLTDQLRQLLLPMANPKRKQSKRRSANRRAANAFIAPEFAKDTDGGAFRPHRVNPKTGIYRGRQVLNVEV